MARWWYVVCIVIACSTLPAVSAGAELVTKAPERIVLDNGMVVLLLPIPKMDRVALTSLYPMGWANEPRGMPRSSDLVRRLVSNCATGSYKAYEAERLLDEIGTTSSGTMLRNNYRYCAVPSDSLELALRVEAERLGSLKITRDAVGREIPECRKDIRQLEPDYGGTIPFAFAVFNQAWRYGSDTVRVKSGMEKYPFSDLQAYYRMYYRPNGAVLALVGGFDRDRALDMIRKHLGSLPSQKTSLPESVRWEHVPSQMDVHWDANVRAVCIAFRPSDGVLDRYITDIWGNQLQDKLRKDQQVRDLANHIWTGQGELSAYDEPFRIYATAKPGVDLSDLRNELESSLRKILESPKTREEMLELLSRMMHYTRPPEFTQEALQSAIRGAYSQYGDMTAAEESALTGFSTSLALWELLTGGNPDRLTAPKEMTADDLLSRLQESLRPSREFVTMLVPIEDKAEE